MKSKVLKIGVIVLCLILIVSAVGCGGKAATPATTPTTFVTRTEFDILAGRVTTVETTQRQYGTGQASATDVNQLKSDLATLKARVDALPPSSDVNTLKTQVADLLDRVSDLETPPTPPGGTTGEATIEYYCAKSIKLDGTYSITLTITNNTGQILKDAIASIAFSPSVATPILDRDNTSLGSTKTPFLTWSTTWWPTNETRSTTTDLTGAIDHFGGYASGVATIHIDTLGSGKIGKGTILTISGNQYATTADVTISGNECDVGITPELNGAVADDIPVNLQLVYIPTAQVYFESDPFTVPKGESKLYLSLTLVYRDESPSSRPTWTPDVYIDYSID